MKKSELIQHLYKTAQTVTDRKKLTKLHVGAVTQELINTLARDLREDGSASLSGFGRFDIAKTTGMIKFTPSTKLMDKIDGDVSTASDNHSDDDDE